MKLVRMLCVAALVFGTATLANASPSYGYEIIYFDSNGNYVGEKSMSCAGDYYEWGHFTENYETVTWSCRFPTQGAP